MDCVLNVHDKRFSGRGQRERSRWKIVVKELIDKKLVESANGKDYVLTKEGFVLADKHNLDTSLDPKEYYSDGRAEQILRIKEQLGAMVVRAEGRYARKFRCKGMRLLNPEGEDLEVSPYGFYEEGILFGDGYRNIYVKKGGGTVVELWTEVLEMLPFKEVEKILDGDIPTLLCKFNSLHPFEKAWYLDCNDGKVYEKSDLVKDYVTKRVYVP